jgi:hypothetical protein
MKAYTFVFLSCVWFDGRCAEDLCKDVSHSFLSPLVRHASALCIFLIMSSFNWLQAELEPESMTNVSSLWNTDNNMNLILNQYRCHQVNAKVLTHTDYKDCDYNDRRKRIKNMYLLMFFFNYSMSVWMIHKAYFS